MTAMKRSCVPRSMPCSRSTTGPRGGFIYEDMDRKMDGLRLIDVVEGDVDWSAVVDESFLPEDLRSE